MFVFYFLCPFYEFYLQHSPHLEEPHQQIDLPKDICR